MSRVRSIFKWFRIVLLLAVLGGVGALRYLNQTHDPRFYQFLNSGPGRWLSGIFNWSSEQPVVEDKPAWQMSAEEREVKERLEQQVAELANSDRVIKVNGQVINGQIVEANDRIVRIKQSMGDSGFIETTIGRDNIVSIERATATLPEVTYRDVRFQMEFADLNLYRRPPYTIVTSERFYTVENTHAILSRLETRVREVFGELYTAGGKRQNIQLLFLSDQEAFDAYRERYQVGHESSVGFYSPRLDRLVLYNQQGSALFREAQDKLETMSDNYRRAHPNVEDIEQQIDAWHETQAQRLRASAKLETIRTIRHEGAHQLFFTCGVHSSHHAENPWLIEGLAGYCENHYPGAPHVGYLDLLRDPATRLVSWPDLVNFRDPGGFAEMNDEPHIAYAQSWLLVDLLMQPANRSAFFDYIRSVRDPDNSGTIRGSKRFDVLCQRLKLAGTDLEHMLDLHLRRR